MRGTFGVECIRFGAEEISRLASVRLTVEMSPRSWEPEMPEVCEENSSGEEGGVYALPQVHLQLDALLESRERRGERRPRSATST